MDRKILEIADNIKYEINPGATNEIQVFFNEYIHEFTDLILEYKLDIESTKSTKQYKILVKVKKLDIVKIKEIFLHFQNFTAYGDFSAYSRSIDKHGKKLNYLFITSNKNNSTAFFCDLIFFESNDPKAENGIGVKI